MSVFDLYDQNRFLDHKIVAGLERLSQVFRSLLWDHGKLQGLSPIQLQLLVFICYHPHEYNTVSYLAEEFQVTKPTVSDAVKALEQKNLILKVPDPTDSRRYSIRLTASGEQMVKLTENFSAPVSEWVSKTGQSDKEALWQSVSSLIKDLNERGIIHVQRSCNNCRFHTTTPQHIDFCNLLNMELQPAALRLDCPEFEAV